MTDTHEGTPSRRNRLGLPFVAFLALTLCGPVLIHLSHRTELTRRAELPWSRALLAVGPGAPWPGATAAWARALPAGLLPEGPVLAELNATEGGRELVKTLSLDRGERLVALESPPDDWQPLLASGRAPVAGAGEVVAGPMCRLDRFVLDGMEFTVTGRLSPGVTAFPMAFVCPHDTSLAELFDTHHGGERAWFYPDGPPVEMSPEELETGAEGLEFLGGAALNWPDLTLLSLAGMAVALLGGTLAWLRLLGVIGDRLTGWAGAAFRDLRHYQTLVVAAHVLFYGIFLGFALLATVSPVSSWRMGLFAQSQFDEGSLSFVGDAYAGGNILHATVATWLWNFGAATVLLTVLPSMVVPFLGVVKNLFSFALVGLALSPVWTGISEKMTYHSGTMVLELEAYVLVSVVMVLYPWHLLRALTARDDAGGGARIRHALASVASGTLLAGAMLALAALYEAVTLIGFGAV